MIFLGVIHLAVAGRLDAPCCCAAIAILWLVLASKRFPLQADTFSCAASTAGKQKWSLIPPSSARVSELTYVTIIETRYPEVDWITDKFLVHNKGNLTVLYNRNKIVTAFTNTEWVSGLGGAIISRSVTSCAGMTAFLVLLAQTRVGFLSRDYHWLLEI